MTKEKIASLLLRIGLAIVFLYAAVASFLEPGTWIAFLPSFLTNIIPAGPLLTIFSIYEIIVAVWLMSGRKIFYAAAIASLTIVGIISSNLSFLDIVFRDFAILFAALALAVLEKE
jgi:uncharacterized membrane protein YphA (DoxX/SURF4 family)